MKNKFILVMVAVSLILAGCTSQKKLDSGDEFSVEADGTGGSDDLSLDDTPASASTSDELSLDEPTQVSAAGADLNDMDAALENELNSLDSGNVAQPAPSQPAADELSLDDPPQTVAQNTPPVEAPAPPAEVPMDPPQPVIEEPPPFEVVESPAVAPAPSVASTISNVQYKGNSGGGTVAITADQPLQFTTRTNSATNQFIVEVQNASIPKKLTRTLNTKDMASSIGSVDIYQKEGSNIARFVVQLRPGASEPIVQPEGNTLLIVGSAVGDVGNQAADSSIGGSDSIAQTDSSQIGSAQSLENATEPAATGGVLSYDNLEDFLIGEQRFVGKKINIDVSGAPTIDVLKLISDESGANIIISDTVPRNDGLNIRLRETPWDQAFVMVLKTKKLVYKRQGNVLYVTTLDDLRKTEEDAINLKKARNDLKQLTVRRFVIAYADVEEMKKQITDYLAGRLAPQAIGGLVPQQQPQTTGSTGGSIIVDKRTNALVVTETDANMKVIEEIIKASDVQPRQVHLASKVVESSEQFNRDLGVSWLSTRTPSPSGTVRFGGSRLPAVANSNVDAAINFGQIDFLGNLDSTIRLAESQARVKTLAASSIVTQSGFPADLTDNVEFKITELTAVASSTASQSVTATLRPGIVLRVTPKITSNDTIDLKISMDRSTLNAQRDGVASNITNTQMFIKSGITAVVSAVYSASDSSGEDGVPGVKDVPILGNLFKTTSKGKENREIMVFITPTVLKPL